MFRVPAHVNDGKITSGTVAQVKDSKQSSSNSSAKSYEKMRKKSKNTSHTIDQETKPKSRSTYNEKSGRLVRTRVPHEISSTTAITKSSSHSDMDIHKDFYFVPDDVLQELKEMPERNASAKIDFRDALMAPILKNDLQAVKSLLRRPSHFLDYPESHYFDYPHNAFAFAASRGGLPILDCLVKSYGKKKFHDVHCFHQPFAFVLLEAVRESFWVDGKHYSKAEQYWDTEVVPYVVKLYEDIGFAYTVVACSARVVFSRPFGLSSLYPTNFHWTALHAAGRAKRHAALKFLIPKFALRGGPESLDITDESGNTCLHYSVENQETVRLLVQSGADVDIRNNQGYSALEQLVHRIIEIASRLDRFKRAINVLSTNFEHAEIPNNTSKLTRYENIANYLLSVGADPTIRNDDVKNQDKDVFSRYVELVHSVTNRASSTHYAYDKRRLCNTSNIRTVDRIKKTKGTTHYVYKNRSAPEDPQKETAFTLPDFCKDGVITELDPMPDDVLAELKEMPDMFISLSGLDAYNQLTSAMENTSSVLSKEKLQTILKTDQQVLKATIQKNDFQTVKCLLRSFKQRADDFGISLELQNPDRKLFSYAASKGGVQILDYLIKIFGKQIERSYNDNLLLDALRESFLVDGKHYSKAEHYWDTVVVPYVVKLYEDAGWGNFIFPTKSDLTAPNSDLTALHVAGRAKRLEAVRFLIPKFVKRGGPESLDIVDESGNTCLHYSFKHEGTVRLLVQYGADVDIRNGEGYSALEKLVHRILEIAVLLDEAQRYSQALSTQLAQDPSLADLFKRPIERTSSLIQSNTSKLIRYENIANYLLSVGTDPTIRNRQHADRFGYLGLVDSVTNGASSTHYVYKNRSAPEIPRPETASTLTTRSGPTSLTKEQENSALTSGSLDHTEWDSSFGARVKAEGRERHTKEVDPSLISTFEDISSFSSYQAPSSGKSSVIHAQLKKLMNPQPDGSQQSHDVVSECSWQSQLQSQDDFSEQSWQTSILPSSSSSYCNDHESSCQQASQVSFHSSNNTNSSHVSDGESENVVTEQTENSVSLPETQSLDPDDSHTYMVGQEASVSSSILSTSEVEDSHGMGAIDTENHAYQDGAEAYDVDLAIALSLSLENDGGSATRE